MINKGNDVPENTIAFFADNINTKKIDISTIIEKPKKQRDWFTPHFYRCLPLTIGNQYGLIIKNPFDFEFEWDGGDSTDSLKFYFTDEEFEIANSKPVRLESWFGHGIITITLPFFLRTPPGINLMTINPPNFVVPNITVMTGVVETDNLRRDFTVNLKTQIPNLRVRILKDTPLAGILPIPRYFADSFSLENAEDIFNEEVCLEEYQAKADAIIRRTEVAYNSNPPIDRDYIRGVDVYGNKFKDHQSSIKGEKENEK